MIDLITRLDLSLLVCKRSICLGEETRPKLCIKRRQTKLASDISNKIKSSCYTEYKAFGPSLIYNSICFKHDALFIQRQQTQLTNNILLLIT